MALVAVAGRRYTYRVRLLYCAYLTHLPTYVYRLTGAGGDGAQEPRLVGRRAQHPDARRRVSSKDVRPRDPLHLLAHLLASAVGAPWVWPSSP